jgi:hypothetical protein
MRKLLLFLALGCLAWAQPRCFMQARPFLKMETGVQGGIAFSRASELLVIPDGSGGAAVWLEEHSQYHRGQVADYAALAAELDALGVYELKNYEPSMEQLDPYGAGSTAIHVHDGKRCFAYSPQRDCNVLGKGERPSEAERKRFAAIVQRLHELEKLANSSATREQFQAAEQSLWKS